MNSAPAETGPPPLRVPPSAEDDVRRIIREELVRALSELGASPQAPAAAAQVTRPAQPVVSPDVAEIDRDIEHYKSILKKLEEMYYLVSDLGDARFLSSSSGTTYLRERY